jgi:hypothetical protein
MKILDKFKNLNYTYYDNCEKIETEYNRMFDILKSSGYTLGSTEDGITLDGGILLENDDGVAAGAFFNVSKYKSAIMILTIFVEEEYRKNGIYTKMHSLIDDIGNEQNKKAVYSHIHSKNDLMQQHVAKSIGYETIMHVVRRPIKKI